MADIRNFSQMSSIRTVYSTLLVWDLWTCHIFNASQRKDNTLLKRLAIFPSQDGMSLPKLSHMAGNI